jgi:type II secretory pathway pseudopilin PulG
MTEQTKQDEILLIDDLLGRLDDRAAEDLRKRLEDEPELRHRREQLARTFAAMDLSPQPEPPADLVSKTLARIAAVRRTEALLDMQQIQRPRSFTSTFTLKELGVIAAMLIVGAAFLIPSMQLARRRGQRSLCAAQLGQIGSALQTYAVNNNGAMPNATTRHAHWLRQDAQPTTSNSSALFRLLRKRYLTSPVVFQCPAVGGPSFAMKSDMTDFPHPEHISFSYHHSFGPHEVSIMDPQFAGVASQMAILADQTPLFAGGQFRPGRAAKPVSENHYSDGENVLYIDGHVIWTTTAAVGVDGDNIYLARGVEQYTGNEAPAGPTDTFLLPAWTRR